MEMGRRGVRLGLRRRPSGDCGGIGIPASSPVIPGAVARSGEGKEERES